MLAERIKHLREQRPMTQVDLAKYLGVTRSGVSAWEMGISTPSTQYIAELASVSLQGLTEKDIQIVYSLIEHLRSKGANNEE